MNRFARAALAAFSLSAAALVAAPASAEDIKLRIASGHPAVNTYVNLMQTFFVPEVTKRVKERTKHTVEFVEGYGGSMVKVADTLEGVQSGIIDIGGYCFCFEPSNLPLHAFQVMLPFGTMSPDTSVKLARAVYDKVPYMSKVFEDKFNQRLLGLIADNGYNLGTNFEWQKVERPEGPQARWRRPEPEVARVRRGRRRCSRRCRRPTLPCRPACTTAGSCSRPAGSTSSCTKSASSTPRSASARSPGTGSPSTRTAGPSCRRTCRPSSPRSRRSTRPRPAR